MSEPRRLTDEELHKIVRGSGAEDDLAKHPELNCYTLPRHLAAEILALRSELQHLLRQECGAP